MYINRFVLAIRRRIGKPWKVKGGYQIITAQLNIKIRRLPGKYEFLKSATTRTSASRLSRIVLTFYYSYFLPLLFLLHRLPLSIGATRPLPLRSPFARVSRDLCQRTWGMLARKHPLTVSPPPLAPLSFIFLSLTYTVEDRTGTLFSIKFIICRDEKKTGFCKCNIKSAIKYLFIAV